MNTNSFIEKKVQLLEDITCHEDFCFQKRRKQNFETDYCECSLKDAKSFLRSTLRDHTAYLKERVEGMMMNDEGVDAGYSKQYATGYDTALSDIFALLDKEINT